MSAQVSSDKEGIQDADNSRREKLKMSEKSRLLYELMLMSETAWNPVSMGELIYIEPAATFTINGHSTPEEAQTVHKGVRIFTDNDNEMAVLRRLRSKRRIS